MEIAVILIFILTGIAMIIFIVGMIFLIRWFIKKGTEQKSPEHIQHEQQSMQARVDSMKKSLAPWGNRSYTDISSWMEYKFSKGMARRLVGTVYSLDKKPIMAFSRVERGFNSDGYFFVGSTNFNLAFEVKDDNIDIVLNQQSLGRITKSGDLFNNQGELIGNAKHPAKIALNSSGLRYRFGETTYNVQLHNKDIATIFVAPNYADYAESLSSVNINENAVGQPIIQLLQEPSPEEEKWLLAIAIIEIVHHGHWMI